MLLDATGSVRRVHEPVTSRDGITAAFDAITYQKGAAVLAMAENELGAKQFRSFVYVFLLTHQFSSIDSNDFLSLLEMQKGGKSAASVVSSFIENRGLPVVAITHEGNALHFHQSRFAPQGSNQTSDNAPPWKIPVCLSATRRIEEECVLLDSRDKTFKIEHENATAALEFSDDTHYYAIDVPIEEWRKLLAQVEHLPRARALDVAISFDIAFAGSRVGLSDYLSGVAQIARHPDWEVALFPLRRLEFLENETVVDSLENPQIRQVIRENYAPKLRKIGLKNDLDASKNSTWVKELERERLADVFAETDADLPLQAELAAIGETLANQPGDILEESDFAQHDIAEAALVAASRRDGESFFKKSLARLRASDNAYARGIWLHVIASSPAPSSAAGIEALLLSSQLRNQEVPVLLYARAAVPAFRDATWDMVARNIPTLLARLEGDLEITLIEMAEGFTSEAQAHSVETTLTPLLGRIRGGQVELDQTLEHIHINAALLKSLRTSIAN